MTFELLCVFLSVKEGHSTTEDAESADKKTFHHDLLSKQPFFRKPPPNLSKIGQDDSTVSLI